MMPRLEAEESISATIVGLMGSGWTKKETFSKIMRQWRKLAEPDRTVESASDARTDQEKKRRDARLSVMGIAVHKVPKETPPDG